MSFYEELKSSTCDDRHYLLAAPVIARCMEGNIVLEDYVAFLLQAYHHVKHTTPLLMAVGSRLPECQEWLREAVAQYIEEELGHQEWVLDDIEACGYDRDLARRSRPNAQTELMVAYAYDTVMRVNPLGFFGMVHVLEGTSISIAESAAAAIQETLRLPNRALRYLRSHGALDQQHVQFFAGLMDRIAEKENQRQIIDSAKMFYRLYGDVLRSIGPEQARRAA